MELEKPHFVIPGNPSTEDQAYGELTPADDLRALEVIINRQPVMMREALGVYETGLEPSNRHKSIQELVLIENPELRESEDLEHQEEADSETVQARVKEKVDDILPGYDLWHAYFRSRLYQLLEGFDKDTEAEIAENEDVKATYRLWKDQRNSERAGLTDQYRELWLAKKMSIYVGRVALSQLDEIHPYRQTEQDEQEQNGKVA